MGNQKSKGQKAKQTMPPKARKAKATDAKAADAKAAEQQSYAPEADAYNRLIIVGSSRVNGRSAALAQQLFDTCLEEYPDDAVTIASVASLTVKPCIACNACRNGACVLDDDMAQVLDLVAAADEVIVVAPVYFAGPSAQFKALLDRLQPFFWTNARHEELRPLTLHVIGEGHDPFGYDPLVTCVSSAFFVAGFELDQVFDWVEKIDAKGEIIDDPDIYVLGDDDDDWDDFEPDKAADDAAAADKAAEDDAAADKTVADEDDDDDDDFVDVDRDGLPDTEELREF